MHSVDSADLGRADDPERLLMRPDLEPVAIRQEGAVIGWFVPSAFVERGGGTFETWEALQAALAARMRALEQASSSGLPKG